MNKQDQETMQFQMEVLEAQRRDREEKERVRWIRRTFGENAARKYQKAVDPSPFDQE